MRTRENSKGLDSNSAQPNAQTCSIGEEARHAQERNDAKIESVVAQSEILGYTLHMATVTQTLRKALEQCGESRYAVGKATGIPASTLSRFAAAGKPLRGENIDKLAAYLGMELTHKTGKTPKGK